MLIATKKLTIIRTNDRSRDIFLCLKQRLLLQLDKQARLTIRVLLFLFLIVKSEVNKTENPSKDALDKTENYAKHKLCKL